APRSSVQRTRVAAVAILALAIPGAASAAPSGQHQPARTVDVALGAAATATSAAAGNPAANAVDGSATTPWCATQWTRSVTVDLGTPRTVTGAGIPLAAPAPPSTASLELATEAGDWQPVPAARNIALNGNAPAYLALGQRARYARLTVTTGDGAPACVGEF